MSGKRSVRAMGIGAASTHFTGWNHIIFLRHPGKSLSRIDAGRAPVVLPLCLHLADKAYAICRSTRHSGTE